MSVRTTRICDHVENGGVCPLPFSMVCPICERDTCGKHTGSNSFGPLIAGRRANAPMEWFSVSLVPICTGCWETISALGTRQEYTEVARKIRAEVILTAKAISAEHKLKSGGK